MRLSEDLKFNVLVFVGSLLFSGGMFYAVGSNTTVRIDKLELKQATHESIISGMAGDIRVLRCALVKDCK